VIGTNTCLHGRDVPRSLPDADRLYPGTDDDRLSRGNTVVIGPDGGVLAGPLTEQAGMLVVTLDLDLLIAARRELDVVGHYARSDVFRSPSTRRRNSEAAPLHAVSREHQVRDTAR